MKDVLKNMWILFVLFPYISYGQSAPDLKELIEAAIANDGDLKEQRLKNELTQLNDRRLKDVFLPRVDLSGEGGYLFTSAQFQMPGLDIPLTDNIGVYIPKRTNNLNISGVSAAAKAEASMLIYSGGSVKHLKKANQEKALAEEVLMEKTTDEIITEISKAYDQFSLLSVTKNVLNAAKKRLEVSRETASKALGYGLITPYDYQKIELAQAVLDAKIGEYEGKSKMLITQLHLLTGIDSDRIAKIQPTLEPIEYVTVKSELSQRAEIRALEHGIKAAENQMKAEERWWVPKIMAKASVSYMGLYDNHITSSEELLYGTGYKLDIQPSNLHIFPIVQAGVGFKWSIFDGREGKTSVAKSQINRDILINQMEDAEKKLKLNLANNQNLYTQSFSQIKLKGKAVEIAKKALYSAEKEFRYGTKTSIELISAENDLINSELEYQSAIFNQRRNAIELMKSTQNLDIEKL